MIKVLDSIGKVKSIQEVYFRLAKVTDKLTINAIYVGAKLIWNLIKSCFGSGTWINNSTWSNTETWKNNK